MAFDTASGYGQVLSPPMLASMESQHTFGFDSSSSSRTLTEPSERQSSASRPGSTSSNSRRQRSRASSIASVPDSDTLRGSSSAKRHRRLGSAGGITANTPFNPNTRSRSGSNSVVAEGSNAQCQAVSLGQRMRNRSTPQLNGLSSLPTPQTLSPNRPLDSSSVPASPRLGSRRPSSGYFDPIFVAQSQNYLLHVSPHDLGSTSPAHASRISPSTESSTATARANQSEWAQQAAHMQQAAHLLGLQRLFASRSTSHLPDLDPTFVGHDFESPPPYAPQASAIETELERAFAQQAPASTSLISPEPPLPPPISIPGLISDSRGQDGQAHNPTSRRPSSRPGPSPRGSRSGPPSPSASFYGRRGFTSLSPLPTGLEMTPSVVYTPQFSAPISPNTAPDSDPEDDREEALTFSSSRSKQWRDARRKSVSSVDNASISNGGAASSIQSGSTDTQCSTSSRRVRSGSTGATQLQSRAALPTAIESYRPLPTEETEQRCDANTFDTSRASQPLTGLFDDSQLHQETQSEGPSSPELGADESEPASPASADTMGSTNEFVPRIEARDSDQQQTINDDDEGNDEFPLVLKMILHTLRVLAAVPGCIGTFWLLRNALMLARLQPSLLSNGNALILANGTVMYPNQEGLQELGSHQGAFKLGRRQPGALDFAVSCLWSMSTAYHALSFTTLLLRRWLLYYSILPSLIRLVALQAICWPLVRLTVFLFGPDQPLGAWVVIGTTTALSDVISRWVTSNIADAPLEGELDDDEDDWDDEAMNSVPDLPFGLYVRTKISAGSGERYVYGNRRDYGMDRGTNDSDWEFRSGDESEAMAAVHQTLRERSERRRQRRGGQGTRFWRAVIGGPSTPSKRKKRGLHAGTSQTSYLSGTATETEVEAESDWAGYGTDRTLMGSAAASLRHRRAALPRQPTTEDEDVASGHRLSTMRTASRVDPYTGQRTILPRSSSFTSANRADSRRKFRWDVAMRRNVLPVAALGYLSMWILILDAMKLGI